MNGFFFFPFPPIRPIVVRTDRVIESFGKSERKRDRRRSWECKGWVLDATDLVGLRYVGTVRFSSTVIGVWQNQAGGWPRGRERESVAVQDDDRSGGFFWFPSTRVSGLACARARQMQGAGSGPGGWIQGSWRERSKVFVLGGRDVVDVADQGDLIGGVFFERGGLWRGGEG